MISGDIDDSNTIIQQNNEENVSIEISDVSKNALNIDESFQGIPSSRNRPKHYYNVRKQAHTFDLNFDNAPNISKKEINICSRFTKV